MLEMLNISFNTELHIPFRHHIEVTLGTDLSNNKKINICKYKLFPNSKKSTMVQRMFAFLSDSNNRPACIVITL